MAGAPRKTSFSPEEMIALGEEMVKWVKENDPIHLSQWYTIHKMFLYKEWKTFIQRAEFIPYYEIVLKMVGMKYIDGKSKDIKDSLCQRWQRVYFKDLRESEDEDLDRAAQRQKEVNHESGANLAEIYEKIKSGDLKISQKDPENAQ